jgi:hypothetical protein
VAIVPGHPRPEFFKHPAHEKEDSKQFARTALQVARGGNRITGNGLRVAHETVTGV